MKIQFTETVLRDANQSLIATRMPFDDFAPILGYLDKAGFYSLECWGGATFDTCLRYLNEDPWERLRRIKKACPNTKLQMLLRGQNILGYKHYADDVVRLFIEKSIKNGIDVIRIFDALNDLRNLEVSINETLKHGAVAQVAISYTTSPIHSLENFAKLCRQMEEMGASSLCIKDMAGVMSPMEAYDLVKTIKENTKLALHVHTHCTTGLAYMTLLKSVEAGADAIDTAVSSFSGGTSQAATETMVYALGQLGYETDINLEMLKKVNDHFKDVRAVHIKSGLLDPIAMATDSEALAYKIPGGMLSNLIAQLEAANAMDRYAEVLEETPKVRAELGYPPLVTPLSQMVGVQATANVLNGERYKTVSKEVQAYIRGEYGTPPGAIDEALSEKVLAGEQPFTGRFADTLAPEFDKGKAEIGALARSDEDVLSYILFPAVAEKYFQWREESEKRHFTYRIVKI